MAGSFSSGSATNLVNEISALNSADVITPAKTNINIGAFLRAPAIKNVKPMAPNPKSNAIICVAKFCPNNNIPREAPKPAPAETPKISGDTRGLPNIP
ncbi:hypothetical protein D9M73_218960 [compost metagenome]